MLPTVELFGKSIPTYGLCGCIGGLLGLLFIGVRSSRFHVDTENAIYIYVLGIVGTLIGAKGLYLLLVLPDMIQNLSLLRTDFSSFCSLYLSGGMVFYGGLLGGILSAWLTARSYHVGLRDYFPVLLPAVALISGFGRIGCFCAGCCYGVEAKNGIGVVFPEGALAPTGIPLVPVQLIEAGIDFALFAFMVFLGEVGRKEVSKETEHVSFAPAVSWGLRVAESHSLAVYVFCYAIIRFVLEFWRGDSVRGHLLWFSTSQWISLAVIAFLVFYCLIRKNYGVKNG